MRGEGETLELDGVAASSRTSETRQTVAEHDPECQQTTSETSSYLCQLCQVGDDIFLKRLSLLLTYDISLHLRSLRKVLSECEGGRSIVNRIDKLPCQAELKKIVRFECATTKREQDIRKLHRLQETTEV